MNNNNSNEDSGSQNEPLGDDDDTVVERLHDDFIRRLREREAQKNGA